MTSAGLSRHLEGWPLGLWLVGVALISAVLAVPRSVRPESVPLPRVDRAVHAQNLQTERGRARQAVSSEGLSRSVRAVGEALRRHGRAAFDESPAAPQLARRLRRLVGVARERDGDEALLALRALQAELFVGALATGERSEELEQLGGELYREGLARGWFGDSPSAARREEARALFVVRFAAVTGLPGSSGRFEPRLNEWLVYYRFLLRQPLPDGSERAGEIERRLGLVEAVARHDPEYPRYLAEGILRFHADDPERAAQALRAHLLSRPDGPWTLRAKNHLAACGARLSP